MKTEITYDDTGKKKVKLTFEQGDTVHIMAQVFNEHPDLALLEVAFSSSVSASKRTIFLYQLSTVLIKAGNSQGLADLQAFSCYHLPSLPVLMACLNTPAMQNLHSLIFQINEEVNLSILNGEFVEYLQHNTALNHLVIIDMEGAITPLSAPQLKDALCQHESLVHFTQPSKRSGLNLLAFFHEVKFNLFKNANRFNEEELIQPNYKITKSEATYPASYTRLTNQPETPLAKATALLHDYTKHGSATSRFFHSHWNRHHVNEVTQCLASIASGQINSVADLITIMQGIPQMNPTGSLARRMNFMRTEILPLETAANESNPSLGL